MLDMIDHDSTNLLDDVSITDLTPDREAAEKLADIRRRKQHILEQLAAVEREEMVALKTPQEADSSDSSKAEEPMPLHHHVPAGTEAISEPESVAEARKGRRRRRGGKRRRRRGGWGRLTSVVKKGAKFAKRGVKLVKKAAKKGFSFVKHRVLRVDDPQKKGKCPSERPCCDKNPDAKDLLENGLINNKCGATNKTRDGINFMVKYDNTPGGPDPKWRIKTECYAYQKGPRVTKEIPWWKKDAGKIFGCRGKKGKLTCPCAHSGGRNLTADEASEVILGQLAIMPIDPRILGGFGNALKRLAKQGMSVDDKRRFMKFDRLRTSLATEKMVQCWKHRCAFNSSIDIQLGSEWGGGFAC